MNLKHILMLLAFFTTGSLTHAGSHTWNGAVSGYWNNNANWSAGGAPDPGETNVTLVFPPGATRYVTTNNIVGLEVRSLALNGDYTLMGSGGAMLTFTGAGANASINGSHVNTIASSLPVVLNTGVLFNLNHVAARLTIDSVISGPQGLGKYGPGVLVLSGLNANTYGNITQVFEGELRLSQANLFPALAVPGRLTIGTTNLAEPALVRLFQNHQIANDNVVVINPSGTLALNGNIDTIGQLQMTGGAVTTDNGADPGALTLGETVTYTHSPLIVGSIEGHLSLGEAMRTFDIKSGTLHITAAIDDGGANAGFTKTGSGLLDLYAANTYDGHTTVNGGYLRVYHPLALGEDLGADAGTTVNWPGHLALQNGVTVTGETLHLHHLGELYAVGACQWNGSVELTGTAFLDAFDGGLCTINGVISGTGLLEKQGLGTLRLEGPMANTFTGGTIVRHGTLQLAKFSGVTAIPGPLTVGDASGPADFDQLILMAHNQIADDAEIRINESGLLDVNGWIESLGPIILDGGHLDSGGVFLQLLDDVTALTNANAVAFIDGKFSLAGSGVFDTHYGGVTPGLFIRAQIVGDANHPLVKRGLGTLRLSHNNADTTFSGAITGIIFAGFTKEGSGRMFLTGTNTYSGKTLVNAGSLFINGQHTSGVNVNPGSFLNGSGTVGPVTATNSVISPGNDGLFGPGQARLNCGAVALDANCGFWIDLGGIDAGTNYCQLNVTGAVNLGNAALSVKLAFASAVSNRFVIVRNDGADAVIGTFKGLPEGAVTNFSGAQFRISYAGGTGNDVELLQLTPSAPPQISGITIVNGQIQITGAGIVGLLYTVQANTNLSTTNWVDLGTLSAAPPAGVLQFIDSDASNYPQRFYRFVLP